MAKVQKNDAFRRVEKGYPERGANSTTVGNACELLNWKMTAGDQNWAPESFAALGVLTWSKQGTSMTPPPPDLCVNRGPADLCPRSRRTASDRKSSGGIWGWNLTDCCEIWSFIHRPDTLACMNDYKLPMYSPRVNTYPQWQRLPLVMTCNICVTHYDHH